MSKRIMFLRDNNNPQGKGNPIGCIAIQIDDVMSKTTDISYQVSICHPNDKFERNVAKAKALGYLVSSPISVGELSEECVSIHQISSMVMANITANKANPKRIRQSAQRWLNTAAKIKTTKELGSLWNDSVEKL